jgi:hypothetical protein
LAAAATCLGAAFLAAAGLAAGGFAAGRGVRKSSLAVNLLVDCAHEVDARKAAQTSAAEQIRV